MSTIELTQDNFKQTITDNEIVVVDFWASWCGPCKSFAPVFEAAAEKHSDIAFAKVDTEHNQELAGSFQIRSIPTLMIFRDQIVLFSQSGAMPANALDELIQKASELDMDQVRADINKQQETSANT